MTAATARDLLEALIWRTIPGITAGHVDGLLEAADRYATAAADERIAGHVHDRAAGRERLLAAAAELSDRRLSVHLRGIAGITACRAEWRKPPSPARIAADVSRVTCAMCKRSRGYKDQARAA